MICKTCGSRLYCKDVRPSKQFEGKTWRRYVCPGCDGTMYTIETEELDYSKRNQPSEELKARIKELEKQVQERDIILYRIYSVCKEVRKS